MKNRYLLLIISAVLLSSCGEKVDDRSDAEASDTLPVQTLLITSSEQNQVVSLSGTIQAEKTAQVAFSIDGKVTSVLVDEGEEVKKGQLLGTIDSREYEFQMERAEASLLKAKDTYTRYSQLNDEGSITPQDFVNSKSDFLNAEANEKSAAKKFTDTKLYAPIDGTVIRKGIEIGTQVSSNTQAFIIAKISLVDVVITVPESQIGNIMHNNTANITIPSLNESFQGKITSINPQADRSSNTFRTKILVDNTKRKLLPGMIAQVDLITNYKAKYTTIPPKAILHDQDSLLYVFLVDKSSNRAIRRKINIGQTMNDKVAVLDGIKDGDLLIIEGQERLKDGQSVNVKQ